MMKCKLLFCSLFFCSVLAQQQENIITQISHMPGDIVKKSMKKAFGSDYKIDRIPVESGVYLQQIISSYNAHMKYAIMNWLKKEVSQGASHNKELYYLLEQLDKVTTVRQAIVVLTRVMFAHQAMVQENSSYEEKDTWQERAYSMIVLQCSVVLANAARTQFLMILDEIHTSLQYWQEQKNHPVKYFFHKSPIKWIKGKRQADEVAANIKKLEKLEYNVRVLLGRLTKHMYAFDIEGNVNTSYAWIDELLSVLSCIGLGQEVKESKSRFDITAEKLHFKLTRVNYVKDAILSKVESAVKPGYLARNWLKYSVALAAAYLARQSFQNNEWLSKYVSQDALQGYAAQVKKYTKENVIDRLKDTINTLFVGQEQQDIEGARKDLKILLDQLSTPKDVGWIRSALGVKQGIVKEKPLSREQADIIMQEEKKGNLLPLQQLLRDINKGLIALTWQESTEPLLQTGLLYVNLLGYHGAEPWRVVANLAIVTPAMLVAGGGLYGLNRLYKYATAVDYTSIRLALLDINSLFIESTAPLSDYSYGKLIYLLQGLKVQALRYLTLADMRNDFLTDLAKLESHKFSVETKRSIIQNMFMKYPFLTLNAKSA